MKNTKVYGVGIYEKGKFSSKDNSYKVWKNILQRCYDPKLHLRHPTYKDCIICDAYTAVKKEKINYAEKIMNELSISNTIQLAIINKI